MTSTTQCRLSTIVYKSARPWTRIDRAIAIVAGVRVAFCPTDEHPPKAHFVEMLALLDKSIRQRTYLEHGPRAWLVQTHLGEIEIGDALSSWSAGEDVCRPDMHLLAKLLEGAVVSFEGTR